jgi:hypothetical protein
MTTITQSISSLGSVPTTADPATFDSRADTFLGTSLPTLRTEINTWAGQANTVAGEVNTNATTATTQAGIATTQASASSASASASAASAVTSAAVGAGLGNFIGLWSAQTGAKTVPTSVSHNGILYYLLSNIADITAKTPGVASEWAAIERVAREARTANTMLDVADHGKIIDITSGTFSQTFQAAATIGNSWFVYILNSGTGDITLDPNGAETIDGLTSFVMYTGEMRMVICTGTALLSYVIKSFYRTFDSSGTFTKPPGYERFNGYVWGGGGSGGKAGSLGRSGGGGGGACVPFDLLASVLGTSETITIGAGGTSITAANTVGNTGGNTTLGALVTSYGGGGGSSTNTNVATAGGSGGGSSQAGTNATVNTGSSTSATNPQSTGYGGGGSSTSGSGNAGSESIFGGGGGGCGGSAATFAGGKSIYGGGGGAGSGDFVSSAAGGVSMMGGAGGANSGTASGNGGAGVQPGGGGAGTGTGNSGAGAAGRVYIRGYI